MQERRRQPGRRLKTRSRTTSRRSCPQIWWLFTLKAYPTVQKELADMQKWDMKSFAISDYKVSSDGSDTVVTTYKVTIEGAYDGKDQTGTYNAASVWKKQKGKGQWQAIFHTNVKQARHGNPMILTLLGCRAVQWFAI